MTNQEAFNIVVKGLLNQKFQSVKISEDGYLICKYRGDSGTKCAAGFLIPDEVYDESMEGKVASDLEFFRKQSIDLNLLTELQLCHDTRTISEWHKHLRHIGLIYNLEWPGDI